MTFASGRCRLGGQGSILSQDLLKEICWSRQKKGNNDQRQSNVGRPCEYYAELDEFCTSVIETRIIEGGEVLRMKEFNGLFVDLVNLRKSD